MSTDFFSRVVKISGIGLIVIFAGLAVLGFVYGETDFMSELFEKIGTIAEIGAIAAVSLWAARLLILEMKKRSFPFYKYVQFGYKLLREHHTLIGWAAFTAALAHGSYFFLQTSEETESIYSGLITLISFAVLVSFGVILNNQEKGKQYVKYKKLHQIIAIVFGIALGIHLLSG